MFKWSTLKVLIMGLGLHGGAVAVAKYLAEEGANIVVTDLKNARELDISVKALSTFRNIRFHLGEHRNEDFTWADLVVPSPAVPSSSWYLRYARKRGTRVLNEAALFFLLSRRRIIGITGTRGKSTTASLIHHFLREKYPRSILAGNIRDTPMFSVVRDAGKRIDDPMVLELSSWHLEGLYDIKKSPHTAVITNLYPDHLNRYETLRDYYQAKTFIFRYQKAHDMTFLNYDSKALRRFAPLLKSRRYWFSVKERFSGDGITLRGDTAIFKKGRDVTELFKRSAIHLMGEHNIVNTLAAAGVAYQWGVRGRTIEHALASFRTLKGRQERIAVKRGITFYNDTHATTPEAVMAFLEAVPEKPVLIMGGSDKKLSYRVLAQKLQARAKGVVLLPGDASKKLKRELLVRKDSKLILKEAHDLKRALRAALTIASHGDTVALSPAAASFGLFAHEFDRGDQFIRAVHSL